MTPSHTADAALRHYNYFDHDADIGIIGRGPSVQAAFVAGAEAMFDLICDVATVRPRERVEIDFEEADLEFAFVTWLNLLLARAHELGLTLGRFELARDGAHWHGAGRALIDEPGEQGILIRTRSMRGAAEEAPGGPQGHRTGHRTRRRNHRRRRAGAPRGAAAADDLPERLNGKKG